MRRLVRQSARAARLCGALAGAAVLLAAAGCTSGDGSASSGNGQDPDPVVLDVPIAYVKRPVPGGQGMPPTDARQLRTIPAGRRPLRARPGIADCRRESTSPGAITQGEGDDIRDVEVSYDGRKVVFAMREPLIEGADEEDQPTWNIWEYDARTRDELRRVIPSDIDRRGRPRRRATLPARTDASSSPPRGSASRKAVLLDEGKPQFDAQDEDRHEPAFVLHVMNADGSGHPADLLQPEPRPGSRGARRRAQVAVQPLGQRRPRTTRSTCTR